MGSLGLGSKLGALAECFGQLGEEALFAVQDAYSIATASSSGGGGGGTSTTTRSRKNAASSGAGNAAEEWYIQVLLQFTSFNYLPCVQLRSAEALSGFVDADAKAAGAALLIKTTQSLIAQVSQKNAEVLTLTQSAAEDAKRNALADFVGRGVALASVVKVLCAPAGKKSTSTTSAAPAASSTSSFPSAAGGQEELELARKQVLVDSSSWLSGVPHELMNTIFGSCKALLQSHPQLPNTDAIRKSVAFILFETLSALGSQWLSRRVTTLFSLWKTVLEKKTVESIKGLFNSEFPKESLLQNKNTTPRLSSSFSNYG